MNLTFTYALSATMDLKAIEMKDDDAIGINRIKNVIVSEGTIMVREN